MNEFAGISISNSKNHNYVNWLEESGIPYIQLDWKLNNFDDIKKCSSLVLTGGCDIFPEFYADWEDGRKRSDYIPERDGFEFRLLDYAIENKIPVLGICRGMQLINIRLGGTLINDIETVRGVNHKKINGTEDRYHEVNIYNGTLLKEIVNVTKGTINSSHHQGIERPGEGLLVSARAPDGIIECIEWEDKSNKPFFIGVQWHPERMNNKNSPFTKNIIERFISETNKN